MRLIDADALMDAVCENLKDGDVLDRIPPQYVDDAPTIEPTPQWIPVTERLPDDGELVLTWSESLRDLTMSVLDEFESDLITHWIPIPELPKGKV